MENPYLISIALTNGPDKGKVFQCDIYDVADSVQAKNAAQIQAIKKVLRGGRADKTWKQDMEEAIKSLRRAIEREEALEVDESAKVPQEANQSDLPTFEEWCNANVVDWDYELCLWYGPEGEVPFRRLTKDVFDTLNGAAMASNTVAIYTSPVKATEGLRDALIKLGKVRA